MKEYNRTTLEQAIRQLPVYEPGEELWERLDAELLKDEMEAPLRAAIGKLPGYEPPREIWGTIAAALDEPAGKSRRLPGVWWRYAAAAAVLVAAATWWFLQEDSSPAIEIVYSEEWVDEAALENDWEQDEGTFREIEKLLSSSPLLQDNAEYHSLRQELEELEDAKTAIEEMMKNYGQDPDLIREMGKLERARTDLVQEMVAML